MIEFRVLGRAELRDGDRGQLDSILTQPKRLAILAYLCLAGRGGFVRRDELIALFWPESNSERARAALNQSLYVLRRTLGPEVLPGRGIEEIGIAASKLRCDAAVFLDRLEQGDLAGALDLYSGDLFPALHLDSYEADRWFAETRVDLRNRALETAGDLGAEAAARGEVEIACERYRHALEIAPESESAALGLVENLWRSGKRTEALEAFERFAARLTVEYGVQPGSEFHRLVGRIRGDEKPPGVPPREEERHVVESETGSSSVETEVHSARVESRRHRGWSRVLIPFGLGVAVIVLIGMWLGRSEARDDSGEWFEANREYLKGWAAWKTSRYDSAQIYLSNAVKLDSTHAQAWALLGYTYLMLNASAAAPSHDVLPRALEAARTAVRLDDTLAAAWVTRATAKAAYLRDWNGAIEDFRHTLTLSTRGNWEAIARADLSAFLADLGRCDEAREAIEPYAAVQPLDRAFGSGLVIRVHYLCGDFDAAIESAEEAVAAGDSGISVLAYLFRSRLLAGDLDGAESEIEHMRAAFPAHRYPLAAQALLEARRGDIDRARSLLTEIEQVGRDSVFRGVMVSTAEPHAQIYAAVGDIDGAYRILSPELDGKGHVRRFTSDPLFEPLRGDPRYTAFLARMGLNCRRAARSQRCQPIE